MDVKVESQRRLSTEEFMLSNCGAGGLLKSHLKVTPVNPKGTQTWIFLGGTCTEAEAPILWPPDAKSWLAGKDPDAGKEAAQDEKRMTKSEMVRCYHRLNEHEFAQTQGDSEGQGGLVCCSSGGCKESDTA